MITWTCFRRLEKHKIFPNWWFNGDFTAVESTKPPQTNKRQVISSHHWSHMIHLSNHLSIVETGSAAILLVQEHVVHGFAYVDISPATIFIRFACLLQGRAPSPVINGVTWGPYNWAEHRWVSLPILHHFTPLNGVLGPY